MMNDYYSAQSAALGNQIKQQMLAENEMKLAEQQRAINEEEQAKAILTQRANAPKQSNPTSTLASLAQPDQVAPPAVTPTELQPQEGLTGLGGMSTPQEGPVGLQPNQDLAGLGGMQVPQEPTVETPSNPITKAKETAKTYQAVQSELDQVQSNAEELRKAGLHDQADKYLEKNYKLTNLAETAKMNHLKAVSALFDHAAEVGQGYLDAIEVPGVNKEAAWQRFLIKASVEGYPIDDLISTPPEERDAKVTQVVGEAKAMKDRARQDLELSKETARAKLQESSNALRIKLAQESTKRQAANQASIKDRWEASQGLQRYKTQASDIQDNIRNAQRDRDDYDQQISALDSKIRDIEAGNILTIKKADRPAAIEALRQNRDVLSTSRAQADNDVKTQETDLNSLHESFKKSGLKEEPVKETAPPGPIDLNAVRAGADKAIKDGADPVKVAARFKEVTGQEYEAKPGVATLESITTELPALKFINSQLDLDRAVKARLLKPDEIKAAKQKIKNLSVKSQAEKASKLEEDRVKKLQELSLKNGPLAPLTL